MKLLATIAFVGYVAIAAASYWTLKRCEKNEDEFVIPPFLAFLWPVLLVSWLLSVWRGR